MDLVKNLSRKGRIFSKSGTKVIPKYYLSFNKQSGVEELVRDSVDDNWYDYIQSSADSCNLRLVFERSVIDNNPALLKMRDSISVDTTMLPADLLEAQSNLIMVQNQFNALPDYVKNDFGNNFNEFLRREGKFSDLFISLHGNIKKNVENKINAGVNSEVQKNNDIEVQKNNDSEVKKSV